ncbi:hypothetical protein C1280_11505 [Gemmata obscuriglobus]|uniref:Uncharacterized protein n=1 Tax=Gemmata obscuriglobus TaxID=114 RepID=A0A2Z3GZT8_9BACT|nr:hypothetical protein C1280_11505 [Gemmata obscuriglobus]
MPNPALHLTPPSDSGRTARPVMAVQVSCSFGNPRSRVCEPHRGDPRAEQVRPGTAFGDCGGRCSPRRGAGRRRTGVVAARVVPPRTRRGHTVGTHLAGGRLHWVRTSTHLPGRPGSEL